MPEPTSETHHEFQYVVLRAVPRVERGECINVGVILYCKALKYLDIRCQVDRRRLVALWPSASPAAITNHLERLAQVCRGEEAAHALGLTDQSQRFHWLSAPRSTIIQPSTIHGGICADPEQMLKNILGQLVR